MATPQHTRPIAAAVLAAGLGRRLGGKPKPALEIDGVSVLERIIHALRKGGAETVSVVVGPYLEHLLPIINQCGAYHWIHDTVRPDLIESQRLAAMKHVALYPEHDLVLTVADLPWLTAEDIHTVVNAWREQGSTLDALWPVCRGVPGHPRILSSMAVCAINDMPPYLGIHDYLRQQATHRVKPFISTNPAYTTDLDTHEDVEELRARISPIQVSWPSSFAIAE